MREAAEEALAMSPSTLRVSIARELGVFNDETVRAAAAAASKAVQAGDWLFAVDERAPGENANHYEVVAHRQIGYRLDERWTIEPGRKRDLAPFFAAVAVLLKPFPAVPWLVKLERCL